MADTVYENPEYQDLGFTRNWQSEDFVQITFIGKCGMHEYVNIPYTEFKKAFEAVQKSVEETKDAWWGSDNSSGFQVCFSPRFSC